MRRKRIRIGAISDTLPPRTPGGKKIRDSCLRGPSLWYLPVMARTKTKATRKTEWLTLRIGPALLERLRSVSDRDERSVSFVAHRAIEREVKRLERAERKR